MTTDIEGRLPATWQELETTVGRILSECGYDVELQKNVKLARGDVNVDVWAVEHSTPPHLIAVECKLLKTAVSKDVVHAFRQVVGDSGANTGLLVSAAGFQSGAVEAAQYSNLHLLTWDEFQDMFAKRWYINFMAPQLLNVADPLIEYTEPVNGRIARRVSELDLDGQTRFRRLRERYALLGIGLMPLFMAVPGRSDQPTIPQLPIRPRTADLGSRFFPDDVLDARALRPFLTSVSKAIASAISEFDAVFGERI